MDKKEDLRVIKTRNVLYNTLLELLKEKSFEEIIYDIVAKFIGISDCELCARFGREYNNNKAQWNDLAYRILGVRGEYADEFALEGYKDIMYASGDRNEISERLRITIEQEDEKGYN